MRQNQTNADIRKLMSENVVRHWELAEKLGLSESTVSKMFRHELDAKTKAKILEAVKAIIEEHMEEG